MPRNEHLRAAPDGVEWALDPIPEPGSCLDLGHGVKWLRLPLPMALDHINVWLLDDGADDGWSLIDCGLYSGRGCLIWQDVLAGELGGRPLNRIFVTHYHPDHVGLAGWLQQQTGARFHMSETEYLQALVAANLASDEYIQAVGRFYRHLGAGHRFDDAIGKQLGGYRHVVRDLPLSHHRLRAGDQIRLAGEDWDILLGTGHSPEMMLFYCPARKLLISGDQILPLISPNVSVSPLSPTDDPLGDFMASLEALKALPADTLVLPSHNRPFYGLHARIDGLLAHHRDRLAELRHAAQTAPLSVMAATDLMFDRQLDGIQIFFALGEALAHLNYLWVHGAVQRSIDRDGVWQFAVS